MITFNRNINTNGRGYWSNQAALVRCVGAALAYENDDGDFGELRIYFDTVSWNVKKNGDIYTDPQFLEELREHLTNSKLAGSDVNYSEHGMQGYNYVSLDVGKPFIDSWKKKVAQFAI
jgi:hypothetical protein